MAVIRKLDDGPYETTYIPVVAFFCAVSCTIIMLKFRGFKASLNLSSRKKGFREHYEKTSDTPVLGAYRTNREEYFDNNNPITPRKITPSMVKLPHTTQSPRGINPSISTSDLSKLNNIPQNSRKSTSDIAASSREHKQSKEIKKLDKEQLKLEKQKMAEQKKMEKIAAREQEKQEKLKKEKHKRETLQTQKIQEAMPRKGKKTPAPQPPSDSLSKTPVQYSTNTLESSISRCSGPPPYSSAYEVVPNQNDNTGNTSFGKPVDSSSSWDLISQHRQQLNRPLTVPCAKTKSTVLDLHYNGGNIPKLKEDKSEA